MLIGVLRRVAAVLTGLAFLGGAVVQALPPSDPAAMAAPAAAVAMVDCDSMAMAPDRDPGAPQPMPCKGVTPDCLKSMNCIGLPNLPTLVVQVAGPVAYGHVAYWLAPAAGDGVSIEPDLLPPIAA